MEVNVDSRALLASTTKISTRTMARGRLLYTLPMPSSPLYTFLHSFNMSLLPAGLASPRFRLTTTILRFVPFCLSPRPTALPIVNLLQACA